MSDKETLNFNMEKKVLIDLDKMGEIKDTYEYVKEDKTELQRLDGVLKSLSADGLINLSKPKKKEFFECTKEAKDILTHGAPEFRLFSLVPPSGISMGDLKKELTPRVYGIAFGNAKKAKLIRVDKGQIFRATESAKDETKESLQQLIDAGENNFEILDKNTIKSLKKRKLVTTKSIKSYAVTKGDKFSLNRKKKATVLTVEHMKKLMSEKDKESNEERVWQTLDWRGANKNVFGQPVSGGYLHPLMKVRSEFRKVLLQMGFEEMPTNQWVESSFWNFDALFQPQFHPARDAHDTFFIKDPAKAHSIPEDYLQRVKDMHENGGGNVGKSKSTGYGYKWSRDETLKTLLRTHTTAVSARMLYKLGQQCQGDSAKFEPKKYFSIDRVFRNESMDKTHLCEFHQVEFFVADRGLSLGHLIGLLRTFFRLIGITKLRFKPAYNPYTEPSMEIFGYHPGLGKWTEVGNSGIFRPEMLSPMGIPSDVNVIAGGVSLERPTMIKYKYEDIRHMFSNKGDMKVNRGKVMPRVIDCSGGATI